MEKGSLYGVRVGYIFPTLDAIADYLNDRSQRQLRIADNARTQRDKITARNISAAYRDAADLIRCAKIAPVEHMRASDLGIID